MIQALVTVFASVGFIGYLIYLYFTWTFNYWKSKGVQGPEPEFFKGNFPNIVSREKNMVYDIDDIYKQYKHQDSFVGIYSMRSPQVLVLDPKLAQEIWISKFSFFEANQFGGSVDKNVDPIFGRNPFGLVGQEWKEKRGELTPGLTASRVKASYPVMLDVCEKLSKFIGKKFNDNTKPPVDGIEGRQLGLRFSCEVVADCVLGIKASGFESDEISEIQRMGVKLFEQSPAFIFYIVMTSICPALLKFWSMKMMPKDMEEFFLNITDQAVKLRIQGKNDRVDFLNYLLDLKAKGKITDIDITAHTLSFLLDGMETSAITISHALLLLGRNPDCQEKLRHEIRRNLSEDGHLIFEKLNDLKYLDQCFYETLRLFSPGLFASKKCTKPTQFTTKNGRTVDIEKGTVVIIPSLSIHRDPEYYPEPEKFVPERFSEENGGIKKYQSAGVFMPFGEGPRICPGMKFATAQVKAAIVKVVQDFRISVNPKTRSDNYLNPTFFMSLLDGGIWLDFEPIANNN